MKVALIFCFALVVAFADHIEDPKLLQAFQERITAAVAKVRTDVEKVFREEMRYAGETLALKKLMVEELDILLSKQQTIEKHIQDAIAKQTDPTKKWELETELDEIKALAKHIQDLDKRLKADIQRLTPPADDTYDAELEKIQKEIREKSEALRAEVMKIFDLVHAYEKSKSDDDKKAVIGAIDAATPKLRDLEKIIDAEVAKKIEDPLHQWLLETETEAVKILDKHLLQLEESLKGSKDTSASDGVYDAALEQAQKEIREKTEALRAEIMKIFDLVHTYEKSMKDDDKKAVVDAIDAFTPKLREAEKLIDAEIAKKIEDPLHQWLLETESEGLKILDKHLIELEERFKKATSDDVYADEEDWGKTMQTIRENALEAFVHLQDLLRFEDEHHKAMDIQRAALLTDLDKSMTELKKIETELADEISHKHGNELYQWALKTLMDEIQWIEKEILAFQAKHK